MNTTTQRYAIQLLGDDGEWVQWYATDDKDDADKVWRRLLESGPQARVRLVELSVLQESKGSPAAA